MHIVFSTDSCNLRQLRKVIIGLRVEWPVSAPAVASMMSHWQGVVSALEYAEWPEPEIRWFFGKGRRYLVAHHIHEAAAAVTSAPTLWQRRCDLPKSAMLKSHCAR